MNSIPPCVYCCRPHIILDITHNLCLTEHRGLAKRQTSYLKQHKSWIWHNTHLVLERPHSVCQKTNHVIVWSFKRRACVPKDKPRICHSTNPVFDTTHTLCLNDHTMCAKRLTPQLSQQKKPCRWHNAKKVLDRSHSVSQKTNPVFDTTHILCLTENTVFAKRKTLYLTQHFSCAWQNTQCLPKDKPRIWHNTQSVLDRTRSVCQKTNPVFVLTILFYSILSCVFPLQEVALRQCLPSSSVLCYPHPYRSLLPHNVISPATFWFSDWSYTLCLPLCAFNNHLLSFIWAMCPQKICLNTNPVFDTIHTLCWKDHTVFAKRQTSYLSHYKPFAWQNTQCLPKDKPRICHITKPLLDRTHSVCQKTNLARICHITSLLLDRTHSVCQKTNLVFVTLQTLCLTEHTVFAKGQTPYLSHYKPFAWQNTQCLPKGKPRICHITSLLLDRTHSVCQRTNPVFVTLQTFAWQNTQCLPKDKPRICHITNPLLDRTHSVCQKTNLVFVTLQAICLTEHTVFAKGQPPYLLHLLC